MTVRAWFRLQRRAVWERPDSSFGDIDRVVTGLLAGHPVPVTYRIGRIRVITDPAVVRQEDLLQLIRRDMDREMQRLGYGRQILEGL